MMYDIILYGATGFTGKRAVAYFKEHAPKHIKWAIAARNYQKLEALKVELGLSVDIFVVDAQDAEGIRQLVQKTKVILSTAGPFALYGNHLIGSCAQQGVHYVDITGEAPWVRDMLHLYGKKAQETKAKIIPFCGFDSVPADLGVFLLRKYVQEQGFGELTQVDGYYKLSNSGFNGGTLLSLLNMLDQGQAKCLADPALLLDDVQQVDFLQAKKKNWKARHIPTIAQWGYPFFMEAVNQKVVYRSIGLAPQYNCPQPAQFAYHEFQVVGSKAFSAKLAAYGARVFNVLRESSFVRKWLKKKGPSSGEGPSEEAIENGFFSLQQIGQTSTGKQVKLVWETSGDAGNKATVCFLCETAFCLLLEEESLPRRYGFLTPSLAFEETLATRLRQAATKIDLHTL